MTREQAIKAIKEAGALPVVTEIEGSDGFVRYSIDGGKTNRSFFPNHYQNMRPREAIEVITAARSSVVESPRRRPINA